MKAYCINLDRRPDRLEHMTAEFARVGIPFERIPAVDGQDPKVAAAAAKLPAYVHGTRVSAGVYGCFESHRDAWRLLLGSAEKWAMIFEDDLILASDISIYLSEEWIPADADIVKLETYGVRVHLKSSSAKKGGRYLHRLCSYHHGAGAYLISADAARQLLAYTLPIGLPVDRAMFDERSPMRRGLVIYQMVPAPVIQGDRYQDGETTAWQHSSLSMRLEGQVESTVKQDGIVIRLRKKFRLRQRLRGMLQGTRYIVVPHG